MNWNNMKIIGSINKSFEALVNQIALSFLKREKKNFKRFVYVNGAGGDGGVESYAVLFDGKEIGIQSKYFDGVIGNTQIKQIVKSVKTAIEQHPNLVEYHIFVSRDLGNKRKGTKNSEYQKIDTELQQFDSPKIILWGEGEILDELCKTENLGIYSFWFEDKIFDLGLFNTCLEKQNSMWLSLKYIPDLFMAGNISEDVIKFCGIDPSTSIFQHIEFCEKCFIDLNRIFDSLKLQNDIIEKIDEEYKPKKIEEILINVSAIISGFKQSVILNSVYNYADSFIPQLSYLSSYFEQTIQKLNYKSIVYNFNKELKKFLDSYEILINDIDYAKFIFSRVLEISGDMGTGKTNIVGYVSNEIIKYGSYGIPINAASVNMNDNIMKIVYDTLGLKYPGEQQALNVLNGVSNIVCSNGENDSKNVPYVVVFFDGCDEVSNYKLVEEREKEAIYISKKYDRIKFIFLGRPYCFKNIKDDRLLKQTILPSGENNLFELIREYFNYYNIKFDGALWALDYIKSPLMLKLFCDVNRGECIVDFNDENSSLNALFSKKLKNDNDKLVELIEVEIPSFLNVCVKQIYELFNKNIHDRDQIIKDFNLPLINSKEVIKILDFLSCYGYISKRIKCVDENFNITSYDYFPGNQSYFDYIDAKISYDTGVLPRYPGSRNIYSIMVIEKEKILISQKFNDQRLFNYDVYSLINCSNNTAILFREQILKGLKEKTSFFRFYFNKILLGTMNDRKNPIGVSLFHEFMSSFDLPIERDLYWSIPNINSEDLSKEAQKYKKCGYINYIDAIENKYDKVNLISVLLWQLSILDNRKILDYRNILLELAINFSEDFLMALSAFKKIYDEQQFENILSVIYGALVEKNDDDFANSIYSYLKTFYEDYSHYRNMSIRYFLYTISEVLYRQFSIKMIFEKKYILEEHYRVYSDFFKLNNPSDGTIFIDYDLSRYVLIDFITYRIDILGKKEKENAFLEKYVKSEVENYTVGNYIISYARQLLLDYGWNDDVMLYEKGESIKKGIDTIIRGIYGHATHGSKSEYMTVCEKYVWIARKQLLTIFAEFFNGDSNQFYNYDMYPCSLMESYKNDNFLEESKFDFKKFIPDLSTKEEYDTFFNNIPDLDVKLWLLRENEIICNQSYSENIVEKKLSLYVSTNMFYSEHTPKKLSKILMDKKYFLLNPDDFLSYYDVYCYISPVQIITGNVRDENEHSDIFSPVSANVCYGNGMDEIYETVPSCFIRDTLGINRYKNGIYYRNDEEVMKYYSTKDNTFVNQSVLSIRSDCFKQMINENMRPYWIIRSMIQTQHEYSEKKDYFRRNTKVYLVEYKNGHFSKIVLADDSQ